MSEVQVDEGRKYRDVVRYAGDCVFIPQRPGRYVASYGPSVGEPRPSHTAPPSLSIEHLYISGSYFLATPIDECFRYDWHLQGAAASPPEPRNDVHRVVDDAESVAREIVGRLLDDWLAASAHQGSMRRAARHPDFQLLEKLGPLAVEMILERLEHESHPLWIWALGELTGTDPAFGTTTVADAAKAWLEWARARNVA